MTDQRIQAPISDETIIALYWARDEKAIAQTHCKYGNYLFTVAYHIVHGKTDCEECLNDTYLAAWNAIPPSRPNVLKAFLTTIMRRIAINRYHKNQRTSLIPSEMTVSLDELEDYISGGVDSDTGLDAKELSLSRSMAQPIMRQSTVMPCWKNWANARRPTSTQVRMMKTERTLMEPKKLNRIATEWGRYDEKNR